MATSELAGREALLREAAPARSRTASPFTLSRVLEGLASLRLTVFLFALSIFLVFVGTLAQKDHGVWDVVNHQYFRVWIAQVDLLAFQRFLQMFYPIHGEIAGSFPFPGGKLIGCALLVNLLAAHAFRFKVAADGRRLAIGTAVIALGAIVTFLVIRSGMNDTFESVLSPQFCNLLWHALRASVAFLALAGAYALVLMHHSQRRIEWWLLLAIEIPVAALAAWLFIDPSLRLDDSGLRILWQLAKGLAAGIVLLAGCILVFRQRAGIVVLHAGVALMMCSELWTGITANEAQMTITEGQTANYASDIRTAELAVVDHSDADTDRVTVIPESLLVANVSAAERIEHADLPFKVQVLSWFPNSDLPIAKPGDTNPATAGSGLRVIAQEVPSATGTDAKNAVDSPAAYVELYSKATGESLGTYLVAAGLLEQPIDVDGHTYNLALRYKRVYYSYSLTLKDFRFDRYIGTNTPKNYSSLIQLQDPTHNVDHEVMVWMNNPLRYADTTFYQADFDQATERTTVLQAVKNPGWMAPYVACMLVFTGMLAHFGIVLSKFLERRDKQPAAIKLTPLGVSREKWLLRAYWFPAIVVAIFALYVGSKTRLPHSQPNEMQVYEFGKLPLAYQGRVKPYDTVARNMLQILSGRQEVIVDNEKGEEVSRIPAIMWFLDSIADAKAAGDHRVFRIENLELLDMLGLEHRPLRWRYSLNELRAHFDELQKQVALADAEPEAKRTLVQQSVLKLADKLMRHGSMLQAFRSPPINPDRDQIRASLEDVQRQIAALASSGAPQAVPPTEATGHWQPLMAAEFQLLQDRVSERPINRATVALSTLLDAYARGDTTTFNKQLADYRSLVGDYAKQLKVNTKDLEAAGLKKAEILVPQRINFEVFYNQFSPFYYGIVLYIIAFVLGAVSWLCWTEPLRKASIWLLWFTFALHTFALLGRIYISGRPPVTNLYSSAIFIGWACVLLALILESIYKLGLGNMVAAVIGFMTLLVAHFLSLDGDTFTVMQAVLDTQFWLATHVVCVNLGYSTTYVAGTFGIAYILLGHVFQLLDEDGRRQLTRMTYGTLCFAIFFSFVGTVLGGLWADDSWGRFWGWDPKENGALMIVLYNALILHARWGGLVRGRGLALLAIGGNIVTTWSYFGTNAFGVGLHAYGGNDSNTATWLLVFALSQFALIILGALPTEWFARIGAAMPKMNSK